MKQPVKQRGVQLALVALGGATLMALSVATLLASDEAVPTPARASGREPAVRRVEPEEVASARRLLPTKRRALERSSESRPDGGPAARPTRTVGSSAETVETAPSSAHTGAGPARELALPAWHGLRHRAARLAAEDRARLQDVAARLAVQVTWFDIQAHREVLRGVHAANAQAGDLPPVDEFVGDEDGARLELELLGIRNCLLIAGSVEAHRGAITQAEVVAALASVEGAFADGARAADPAK